MEGDNYQWLQHVLWVMRCHPLSIVSHFSLNYLPVLYYHRVGLSLVFDIFGESTDLSSFLAHE